MIGILASLRTKGTRSQGRPEKDRLIEAVEAARVAAGVSQRELSRQLGLHEMTIMRFARGERMLDVIELIDVAKALGKDPVELLRLALIDEPKTTI